MFSLFDLFSEKSIDRKFRSSATSLANRKNTRLRLLFIAGATVIVCVGIAYVLFLATAAQVAPVPGPF